MKKLSLRNKFSKYIHKSFQKWPFLVQVGSKAQQPPRSPIWGHFEDENTIEDNDLFLTKVLDKPDLRSEVKSKSKSKSRSKCRDHNDYRPAKHGVLLGSVAGSKCTGKNYTGRLWRQFLGPSFVLVFAQVSTATPWVTLAATPFDKFTLHSSYITYM